MNIILSLNDIALCPFEAVLQIAEQLGHTELDLSNDVFKPSYELNKISDWVLIDDSLGDLATLKAQQLNTVLSHALAKQEITALDIHIYLGEMAFTNDNLFSLLYLSGCLAHLHLFFYVSPPHISTLQKQLHPLNEKPHVFIQYRSIASFRSLDIDPQSIDIFHHQRQKHLNRHGLILDEQLRQTPSHIGIIIGYAWTCLKSGAYELGCRLLESYLALKDLDSQAREQFTFQLQIIRFLSHQHHRINDEHFTKAFEYISPEQVKHLHFIRAFGATLTRRLDLAETLFQQANIGLEMAMSDEESIYKLNLYALYLLVKGEADTAFALEQQLQAYLQTHYPQAHILMHVILMNIARLYKKSKQYDLAKTYYQKAYGQLNAGTFTLYDAMNYSIDTAILCESKAEMRDALYYWLKVALSWLSSPNPYSLPVRTRLVLCQEKVTDSVIPVSQETVNRFLVDKLNRLCVLAEVTLDTEDTSLLQCMLHESDAFEPQSCFVRPHMILYTSPSTIPNPLPHAPMALALQRLVSALVKQYIPLKEGHHLLRIDNSYSSFHAQLEEELMTKALEFGCNTVDYHGKRLELKEIATSKET
jgi:hypothetical protein